VTVDVVFKWMVLGSYLARGTGGFRAYQFSVFRFLCASVFVDATLFTVNIYNKSVTSAQLYVAVRMLPLSLINLNQFLRLLHQFVWVEIEPEVDIR